MCTKIKPGLSACMACFFYSTAVYSQDAVPVWEEPRHKPVFQNKYIRLLDVWLPPGDTSLYHIHSIPSLFVFLNSATIGSQLRGESWTKEKPEAGKTWYRSFLNDELVHRVSNEDTIALHVIDLELLSTYDTTSAKKTKPLPFPLLYENERAFAWRLTNDSFNKYQIKNRGPMIAELAAGDGLIYYDTKTKKSTSLKQGMYLFIEPKSTFYFSIKKDAVINMVLFELK